MRRRSSTISRRGYPLSELLTSPSERGVDVRDLPVLSLSAPTFQEPIRALTVPGSAWQPMQRETADVCGGSYFWVAWYGLGHFFWHDEEAGLDRLTARTSATASSSAKRSVWGSACRGLRLRLDRYVRRQAIPQQFGPHFSTCRHQRCPRWLESLPLPDALDRLDGPTK